MVLKIKIIKIYIFCKDFRFVAKKKELGQIINVNKSFNKLKYINIHYPYSVSVENIGNIVSFIYKQKCFLLLNFNVLKEILPNFSI